MPLINPSTSNRKYPLPDAELLDDNESLYRVSIWEPPFMCIILGQGNDEEESVIMENARLDSVPVFKRPSGGEAVVLSPRMTVISILKREDGLKSPKLYFDRYNSSILLALRALGVRDLKKNGTSDICIGDKKILGSSIYRGRERVFYHAVLNRGEPPITIERYLKHPRREPLYRAGRAHAHFVTSLVSEGYTLSSDQIREALSGEGFG